jgi:hypothetical protein
MSTLLLKKLTHSAAPSRSADPTAEAPPFKAGVKKRRSGSTLSLRPELRPRDKPRPSGRGVEGLRTPVQRTFSEILF